MKFVPALNNYYIDRIEYCILALNHSTPGKRIWNTDPITGYNDYTPTERSTFPEWAKFFYEKRPKKWYLLSEEEKLLEPRYFCGNTPQLIKLLKKTLTDKKLTEYQQDAIEILFDGLREEEEYYFQRYGEVMIPEIDLSNCPF